MKVLEKIAFAFNRRDEVPNQELAAEIVRLRDTDAVNDLIENLSNKNKNIQADVVKVLYEIGDLEPSLISAYTDNFIHLLESKNNRLQWGAMSALKAISKGFKKMVFEKIPQLALAAEKGTVITRDNYVAILINLASENKYREDCLHLIAEQISSSPINQVPMYAEKVLSLINGEYKQLFFQLISSRLKDFEPGSKLRRMEQVLTAIRKIS